MHGADVVVTATSSKRAGARARWLAPGAHVNAVGASTPTRDGDRGGDRRRRRPVLRQPRVGRAPRPASTAWRVSRALIPGEGHIRAELGEVLAGTHAGPQPIPASSPCFARSGIGVEDLAAAQVAVRAARARGLGTEVEL